MRRLINNEKGLSSLAFAMFFTLVLGYFSVIAMQGVNTLMTNHSLVESQNEKVRLRAELTLVLSSIYADCKNSLVFTAPSTTTSIDASISNIKIRQNPSLTPDLWADFMRTNQMYNNLRINSISLKQKKQFPPAPAAPLAFLADMMVRYSYANNPIEQSIAVPVYFQIENNGLPITNQIKSCYSSQMTLSCDANGYCYNWHESICNVVNTSGTSLIWNPIKDECCKPDPATGACP
jgi:hypothetical protein